MFAARSTSKNRNSMIVIYTFYIQNIALIYVAVITMFSAFVPTGLHHAYIDPGNLQEIPNENELFLIFLLTEKRV